MTMTPADTTTLKVAADTTATDSLGADTDTAAADTMAAIVVTPASRPDSPVQPRHDNTTGASWLILGLLAVICVICVRFKNNIKYLRRLFHDLTDTRARGNVFDDTSSETSFIITLNTLCAFATGLMLYIGMTTFGLMPRQSDAFNAQAWGCICAAAVYCAAMPPLYTIIGYVFSDQLHTRLWRRGFLASQALAGLILLTPALMAVFYPAAAPALVYMAIIIYASLKIIFISKTFRIFFSQISAYFLFLYYLCTVEIIPLLLTLRMATAFAG